MTRTIRGIVAATLLVGTSAAALSQGLGWRVSEAAGPVTIRHGATTRPAQRGATLEAGDAVQTGTGGRAVLVREKDFVTVSPNSRVSVPVDAQATGFVKIVQDLGNAIFKIEKLGVPHFGVNTPYLAAVVKGTTFSVTVDTAGTSLQVVEGAVEVATLDGGARDLIRPGDVATIAAGDLFRLRVQGDTERTVDSPGRPAETGDAGAAQEATTTPVIAVASPAPVNADGGSGEVSVVAQAIGEGVSSKPVDLAAATGGMIFGTTGGAALIATVRATETAPVVVAAPTVPAADPAATSPSPVASPADVPAAPTATPVNTPSLAPPSPGPATETVTTPAASAPVTAAPTIAAPTITPVVATPAITPAPEVAPTPAASVTTAPVAVAPVLATPVATAPEVVAPIVTVPTVPTPTVTTPAVATPVVTTPVVTTPVVTTPVVTTPVVTTPVVTTPVVTTPVVTTPVVTTPVVTTPVVTTPVVTTPVVTTPVVTTPMVTTPVVTTPVVTTPVVTTPVVTTPVVTAPSGIFDAVKDLLDRVGNQGRGNNNGNGGNRGRGNAFGRGG